MRSEDYRNPEFYINRELSWLEFNDRVLDEARDKSNPLFERIKFLAITSSNLDEFFMIRAASLKDQVKAGYTKIDISGLTPKQQLKQISVRTHVMVDKQYNTLNRSLFPLLGKSGIKVLPGEELDDSQKAFLQDYFSDMVYPVLTPMAVDSRRPFPLILSKSLNIGILLKHSDGDKEYMFATVQVPAGLPRMIELPGSAEKNGRYFIFLEEIIMMFLDTLFTGREILCAHPYRITRNADLTIDEEEAEDLLLEIEKSLKKRNWGAGIRLEIDHAVDDRLLNVLKNALDIHKGDIYYIKGPIDLTFLMKLSSMEGYRHLKYKPYEPQYPQALKGEEDIFGAIDRKDVFVHHPYDSFDAVVGFIEKASRDPDVLAIKQTLYRVSGNSPIVRALEQAAESGKQVMVLLEVKARFDEERNIQWAKRLEQAGCHVIYGLVGLKTHCKITLVVRREESGIKRYVHLGTGNYNDITATLYTDMGLFTTNEYIGADASAVFNMLSGYSEPPQWYKLEAAPVGLRKKLLSLIENERQNALAGNKAVIMAKMNSLVDRELIAALYSASAAGVQIKLIVRGICCLRPGIKGVSENITVISIVGRFLEHSRVNYFYNDGREDIYLSSADWMPRNLDARVELLFPVEDSGIKDRIIGVLEVELADTLKARVLEQSGKYRKIDRRGKKSLDSQMYFCKLAVKEAKAEIAEADFPKFEALHLEDFEPGV
ncbi:MAG: Polyphosphate kinase [Firmicutes bacterium]|nr:Polyphosphate kinase [Bacillota bacterium]